MKYFYTKDLDELIIYRSDEFIDEKLPLFSLSEIDEWNKYNEDIQILPCKGTYILDKTVEEFLYNKAEGHNIDYRIIYRHVSVENKSFVLMSRIPMIETEDLLSNLVTQYGLIIIVLLTSLLIVQRIISKKLWTPFYNTLDVVEDYRLEQGIIPEFEKNNIKEFTRLNEMLTNLIKNDIASYKQQKEFIENASHELQTPLAVFQSQLDILLQESDLKERHLDIIQSLYSVSSRMARLNKNLLLLTKIDNAQFNKFEKIDLVNMLNISLPLFKDLVEKSGLELDIEMDSSLIVRANAILLESLINNLIVNAIRHNKSGGKILISVKDDSFTVSNSGDDEALDSKKIFSRFNRKTEEKQGNGLGLSIVSQICKLHDWNIEYSYQSDMHVFKVKFPMTKY